MLNRLQDGFEGNLTTIKWAKLAKWSHDTALRDIQEPVNRGILVRGPAGGRSTSYALADVSLSQRRLPGTGFSKTTVSIASARFTL
jgi:hypothetical protein